MAPFGSLGGWERIGRAQAFVAGFFSSPARPDPSSRRRVGSLGPTSEALAENSRRLADCGEQKKAAAAVRDEGRVVSDSDGCGRQRQQREAEANEMPGIDVRAAS